MNDWTAGYVADIAYTYGYYGELNPLRVKLAFLNAGLAFPEVGAACELGFGQGMSANLHAAGSDAAWYGTDFNPGQAAFAKELGRASGASTSLHDESFEQFCHRADLPEFDYIGLHGIWSWVSDENRSIIVDFIRRKLKVGGVLYISYNTQPGWSAIVPLRDLLTEHSQVMGAPGHGIAARIDSALEFADKLMATKPAFATNNPAIASRLEQMKTASRNYLAHEYFNRDWAPMSFSRMAEWLSSAKLTYACSAHLTDHVDHINMSAEQQELINSIPDPMFRQTVRDYCTNQTFRRDYWVKGARPMNPLDQAEALRELRVVLTVPRANASAKVKTQRGEATINEGLFNALLEVLSDHQVKTVGQIEQALAPAKITFTQIVQTILLLSGGGAVQPAQSPEVIEKARKSAAALNRYLCGKSRNNGDLNYLASPVTGGGIAMTRFFQMYLLAIMDGKTDPDQIAASLNEVLKRQGQRLTVEGKTMETDAETLAHLGSEVRSFMDNVLPVLRALAIV